MSSGQKNKFHQSGILQLSAVVLAADPREPRAEGAWSKGVGEEGTFGISASEQDVMSFSGKSNHLMKI